MIAPNPMYFDQLRNTWKRALAYTVGCALASAIVFASDWGPFSERVLYLLVVSFCVGLLLWLLLPVLTLSTQPLRPTPRSAVRIAGAVLTVNVGVMIGLAAIAALDVFPWVSYWSKVRDSVMPTTVVGLICVVGLTMYRSLEYRAKYETAQARLASLESRLRPHFLFNTLNSILALIREDPKAAELVTERLARLLRYSLDATEHSTVRLDQELKVATEYLEIEKTRFGDRLRYSIDVPDHLMPTQVPPFCLQTLVENSVKYGGGEIRVSAHNGNGRLLVRVWDSGTGFPEDAQLPAGHGLHNLKERLDALWGSNAAVEFPRQDIGTTVQISIPASLQ